MFGKLERYHGPDGNPWYRSIFETRLSGEGNYRQNPGTTPTSPLTVGLREMPA